MGRYVQPGVALLFVATMLFLCSLSSAVAEVIHRTWQPLTSYVTCSLQEACSLAQRCLRRAQQRGASRHTAAKVAASVLTRAAIDQGSSDNVTVVVVDLSRCGAFLLHIPAGLVSAC